MGKRRVILSLVLAAAAAVIAAVLYLAPPDTASFANRIADYRLHGDILQHPIVFGLPAAPPRDARDPQLALITIDEESVGNTAAGLGQFPFPRSVYGTLLRRLGAAGARAVAFDIDFLEPSADPAQDRAFAAGGRAVPAVIGFTASTTASGIAGAEIPPPALRSALRIGSTTIDSPGGIIIGQALRIAPDAQVPGGVADALSLQAVNAARKTPIDPQTLPAFAGLTLTVPFRILATVDTTQRAGAETTIVPFADQKLSFADALTEPPADLKLFAAGKVVLVGSTAQALNDKAATVTGIVPGMYVHARLIDQLLTDTFITPAPQWLDLALMLLLPLVLAALLAQIRPTVALLLSLFVVVAYIEIAAALFVYRLYWLDVMHVAGAMLLASLGVIAFRAVSESAQRRAVTNAFGLHVSPGIVKELLKHEGGAAGALAGKRAKTTIFYSDIRGFTAMSERMSAEAVYDQLNEYFEAMCDVIFQYGGYVDKFIGDCIMAVFSAPNQTPDDARKAVEAALDQQAVIEHLAQRWQEQGKPPLSVGMGINTGYVVMGNLGSQKRMNYTVIGDDVNVAARLYNVAKGGQIIISESTYDEVKDFFIFRELEPVSVKGKSAPLRTFEVLARRTPDELPGPLETASDALA
ncbi:MAG TPA: adenylate/guanylate cyclase domain-containing protein [Candidatus Baltobacteraceae bacterium]|nr:adenylate/guanylate cyclase domain-containing protein [Candidatus Baltobacteraceae bacterium]